MVTPGEPGVTRCREMATLTASSMSIRTTMPPKFLKFALIVQLATDFCELVQLKFTYVTYFSKIAKARPHSANWVEYTFVQSSGPWLVMS